jgi:tetratricopeptide (TPR) repeat protein
MTARPEVTSPAADSSRIHRAGSAWTDRGTQRLVAGGPDGWAASVRCHERAVELLSELPIDEDISYRADLGAAWVNLGCALQSGPSRESLRDALDAFDRAVDVLSKLPFEDHPRFRHNLAAAWMNRADAFARIDTAASRTSALQAYGRAIEIAGELPLDEKPSFRVLLASCWINLGNLHERLMDFSNAVRDYDEARGALGNLPRSGHRLACHHAATAETSRGEALLSAPEPEGARQAVEAARMALAQIEGSGLDGLVDAKLSLRALRVMARGLESLLCSENARPAEAVAELTDVAERGLDLAFGARQREPQLFDPFIAWFFSFGSCVYGRYQPQFLAEFLGEGLDRWDSGASPEGGEALRSIARRAAAGTLEELGRGRLLVSGTRQTERLVSTVRELREAASHFYP